MGRQYGVVEGNGETCPEDPELAEGVKDGEDRCSSRRDCNNGSSVFRTLVKWESGGISEVFRWVLRIVGEPVTTLAVSAVFDLETTGKDDTVDVCRDNLGRFEVAGVAGGITEIILHGVRSCGWDGVAGWGL